MRIRFSVWLVIDYAQVFLLLFRCHCHSPHFKQLYPHVSFRNPQQLRASFVEGHEASFQANYFQRGRPLSKRLL